MYRLRLVKVTSPHTERSVKFWDFKIKELPRATARLKFEWLPMLPEIKKAVISDWFMEDK